MNLLFLDIDGPLAFGKCFFENRFYITKDLRKIKSIIVHRQETEEDLDVNDCVKMPYGWHEKSCQSLASLIKDLDLKIVISSDWKMHYSLKEISKMFEFYGIPHEGVIIDMTPRIHWGGGLERARMAEIETWLESAKESNLKWVAVDDMNLSGLGKNHYVYTDTGISSPGVVKKIKECFSNQ